MPWHTRSTFNLSWRQRQHVAIFSHKTRDKPSLPSEDRRIFVSQPVIRPAPGWQQHWQTHPMAPSTWLLGLGNSQLPLGKHSQTAELKKANYSAPLRALANWRWKPGRRNCRDPIGQPYAATPHDGIACIGTPLCIGMALIAVTSPRRSPRNNAGTAWSAAFHQVDSVGLGGTSPYGGWRVFKTTMSRPWRCSGRLK